MDLRGKVHWDGNLDQWRAWAPGDLVDPSWRWPFGSGCDPPRPTASGSTAGRSLTHGREQVHNEDVVR